MGSSVLARLYKEGEKEQLFQTKNSNPNFKPKVPSGTSSAVVVDDLCWEELREQNLRRFFVPSYGAWMTWSVP